MECCCCLFCFIVKASRDQIVRVSFPAAVQVLVTVKILLRVGVLICSSEWKECGVREFVLLHYVCCWLQIATMALHRHHLLANNALCSTKSRTLTSCVPKHTYRAPVYAHALPQDAAGLPGTLPSVVTNDAVPEGHKSLHNALYGQEGDAHGTSRRYNFREVRGRACRGSTGLPGTDLSGHKPCSLLY